MYKNVHIWMHFFNKKIIAIFLRVNCFFIPITESGGIVIFKGRWSLLSNLQNPNPWDAGATYNVQLLNVRILKDSVPFKIVCICPLVHRCVTVIRALAQYARSPGFKSRLRFDFSPPGIFGVQGTNLTVTHKEYLSLHVLNS